VMNDQNLPKGLNENLTPDFFKVIITPMNKSDFE